MIRRSPLLITAAFALTLAASASADVVLFQDGKREEGEVLGVRGDGIRVAQQVSAGRIEINVPADRVKQVAFALSPSLRDALANPSSSNSAELAQLWNRHLPYVGVVDTGATAAALAYLNALALSKDDASAQRILDLESEMDKLVAADPSAAPEITGLTAIALIRLGRTEEALDLAQKLDTMGEDIGGANREALASARILATFTRAGDAWNRLRQLDIDWPKWHLMPEKRRERLELTDSALDGYLTPSVLFPENQERAAEGLLKAAEIERYLGDDEQAVVYAREILDWYPDTPFQKEAQALATELTPKESTAEPEKS